MTPVECSNGVYADEDENRSFDHRDGDDIYRIKLIGKKVGGTVRCSHYVVHHMLPRQSFGQWLIDPNPRRVDEESHIYTEFLELKEGEEKEIMDTGLYVTGS